MMDTTTLAVIITVLGSVLLGIIGLAAAWGRLSQRVDRHDKDIADNRKEAEKEREKIHRENREDHRQIFAKLEEINNFIRNGKK